MKKTLQVVFLLLLAFFALLFLIKKNFNNPKNLLDSSKITKVIIGNTEIPVVVADTEAEREQGLSGKETRDLAENSGMLFVFPVKVTPVFWMIDMKFPLDIIWISNGKIISISKNVPNPPVGTKSSDLPKYSPGTEVDYVVEVHAGFSDKNNLKQGDSFIAQ